MYENASYPLQLYSTSAGEPGLSKMIPEMGHKVKSCQLFASSQARHEQHTKSTKRSIYVGAIAMSKYDVLQPYVDGDDGASDTVV
jgi:hypothetical protein